MHAWCCRYERGAKEDGRRCHKWFLVDEAGTEHLAVIGIETDTLDGHYTYQAVRFSIRQLLHSTVAPAVLHALLPLCSCPHTY